MDFSDSSWKACPDTGRTKVAYIVFYQGGPIDHITHIPVPVAKSGTYSEYSEACTARMALSYLRILIH